MNTHGDSSGSTSGEPGRPDRLARWLIQHAARSSPAPLAERLEEEWLAHLAARTGAVSRLRFAVGCCWATRVIAHDYLASGAPASSAATAHGSVLLGQRDLAFFSRRSTILLLIVALHVLVIYGFATGFAQKAMEAIPRPLVGSIVNQSDPHPLPPPPIGSRLVTSRLPLISPIGPAFELPTNPIASIGAVSAAPPPPPSIPRAPTRVVRRVLGGPGAGFPNTEDYYPLTSRRLGEVGAATVRVCVDERGRLASAPTIAQSAGSARLDDAALRLAKAGSGHYRTTTEDGMPVTYCYPFRIRFQLRE